LLPSGYNEHAACLLVTKLSDNTFRLTLFNTGAGINKWHHRLEGTNHFQTFYTIDDVPLSSVTNQQGWEKLFCFVAGSQGMDPIYSLLNETLGRGGKILPPEKDGEWYEAKQSSGTCSIQSLMALMRHQIIMNGEGTLQERKALYKMIKGRMFQSFVNANLSKVDEDIRVHSKLAIDKFEAELRFAQIAENPDLYQKTFEKLCVEIEKLGKKELVAEMKKSSAKSNLERYANLRAASDLLSTIGMTEAVSVAQPNDEAFRLALVRRDKNIAAISNLKNFLDQLRSEEDEFLTKCVKLIISYKHRDIAVEKLVNLIGNENPKLGEPRLSQKVLVSLQRDLPDKRRAHIDAIAKALEKKGNKDLAEWIQKNG
jgi:hypothetical protein